MGHFAFEQVVEWGLGDRVQASVVSLPAGPHLGQQITQGQCELFPLLAEFLDDFFQAFGQPAVVLGILVPVLTQVVADRVFHLRCLGPVGLQVGDLGVEVGGGD